MTLRLGSVGMIWIVLVLFVKSGSLHNLYLTMENIFFEIMPLTYVTKNYRIVLLLWNCFCGTAEASKYPPKYKVMKKKSY